MIQHESHNERYSRQILLKKLGIDGQKKLSLGRVLMVGAGGLGCPALQYLTAAGVGTIGMIDDDRVEINNLHRQILFTEDDIGELKTRAAIARLKHQNSMIHFKEYPYRLTNANALELISSYDVIVDGSDNYQTRYILNDACVLAGKPLVYGAVLQFEGQLSVFNFKQADGTYSANYRDLYPTPPSFELSCNTSGVLGVLPGIIGLLQATEAIKIITGIGNVASNKLLSFQALELNMHVFEYEAKSNHQTPSPKTIEEFTSFDYNSFCHPQQVRELSITAFDELVNNEGIVIIDLREETEISQTLPFKTLNLPYSLITSSDVSFPAVDKIVFLCQEGRRSLSVLKKYEASIPNTTFYSLQGGITAWFNKHKMSLYE